LMNEKRDFHLFSISSMNFFSSLEKEDKDLHLRKHEKYWSSLSHFRFEKACMITRSEFFRNCEQIFRSVSHAFAFRNFMMHARS